MKIIGITGGIGSGKSTITHLLETEFDCYIIDADKLGHETYIIGSPCYMQLIEAFGNEIITSSDDPSINRKALGSIVFSDSLAMKKLQSIVWPAIRLLIIDNIEKLKNAVNPNYQNIVIEAAILIEAGWYDLMDIIILIETPRETAIERIISRNNISEEDAIKRIDSQMSNDQRRIYSNYIITNDQNIDHLRLEIEKIWNCIQVSININKL